MPNPLAMIASSGERATGAIVEDDDGETIVPPVCLSVLCYSGLAYTDSATDCCWAQVVPKARTHTLPSLRGSGAPLSHV